MSFEQNVVEYNLFAIKIKFRKVSGPISCLAPRYRENHR